MAINRLSPQEASSILKSNNSVVLIDVREKDEYDYCKIDSSILCPLSNFQESFDKNNLEKDTEIILYCHHGKRSLSAAQYLYENGFINLSNLEGGIDRWSNEVDTSIPRY